MTFRFKDGARAPYIGCTLDNCHAQEQLGFPKAKVALMGFTNAELECEQREMLKASFGRMFGHNAKKMLALIEAEMAARAA